jgi:hypothetical protein
MKNVAKENNFAFNQDVKLLSVGSPQLFYDYLENNQNTTWFTVIWCTSEWTLMDNVAIPCKFNNYNQKKIHGVGPRKLMLYSVYYNYTLAGERFLKAWMEPAPSDRNLMRVKLSVDNAIIRYLAQQRNMKESEIPHIEMSHASYPIIADRMIKDVNLIAQLGGYFFVLGPLLSFTIFLNEVVREKELKLRQGLSVVGVGHTVYWLSWIIIGCVFSAMTSVSLVISGLVCGFDYFWNVPSLITFFMFFFFSMAMITLAFFVSTIVPT